MSTSLMQPDKISSSFEEFLNREIYRLRAAGVFSTQHNHTSDSTRVVYEDYLKPFGPSGSDENHDATIRHIANFDNLGRFAVSLEQTDANLIKTIAEIGVEDILPTELTLPANSSYRPDAPWKTLNAEIKALFQALNVYEYSDERVTSNPSVSQITPYMERMVTVNKAASITFKRLGLEDVAKHFAERAQVLDLLYDQRLAFEGKPTNPTVIDKRYKGNDNVKALAAHYIVPEKQELPSLDVYLIMIGDQAHPTKVPGFKPVEGSVGWNDNMFALGEKSPKTLELMTERVKGDERSPGGYGFGPFYNAVGEFGFTKRGDILVAMYMHFGGEIAKEFTESHPNGVTYLTWLFGPDFEPTGTLTREQMLKSKIVEIPSRFVAGETDKSRIAEGMNRFIGNMMRMTGVTHKMYKRGGLTVFPTLYSDLSVDRHVADIVLNYKPKK